MRQFLKNCWAFVRKYGAILIGLLLTALAAVALTRPKTETPSVPQDADRDGKDDNQQIEEAKTEARQLRDSAESNIKAAEDAVNRTTKVTQSKDVREAVDRNNEVDY